MRDRRNVEDLTLDELEQVLYVRRREERLARLRRMDKTRPSRTAVVADEGALAPAIPNAFAQEIASSRPKSRLQVWRERILMGIEGAALLGLIAVLISLVTTVRTLNQDWRVQQEAHALPAPTATALIRAAVLPGGHKPPTMEGGEAQPIGFASQMVIPTPGPRSPTRLLIPGIHVDVPVVEGDDWEQLKKGAGHHIGSANPGERGNTFISGHNDVYGEIFRRLEEVKMGDEIIVYAGERSYRYFVRATRIVEPDDVSVMYPTSTPILTLLTCYPYMVDSHRLVVIAELER
jgi:sortase A